MDEVTRDVLIQRLDDVRYAIRGTARLALHGEAEEMASTIIIEVAALLDFTADALDTLLQQLERSTET